MISEGVAISPSVTSRRIDMKRGRHIMTIALEIIISSIGRYHSMVIVA